VADQTARATARLHADLRSCVVLPEPGLAATITHRVGANRRRDLVAAFRKPALRVDTQSAESLADRPRAVSREGRHKARRTRSIAASDAGARNTLQLCDVGRGRRSCRKRVRSAVLVRRPTMDMMNVRSRAFGAQRPLVPTVRRPSSVSSHAATVSAIPTYARGPRGA